MTDTKQSDAKKRRLETLTQTFQPPSTSSPPGVRPAKKAKKAKLGTPAGEEQKPERPPYPYITLRPEGLPAHLMQYSQQGPDPKALSSAEELLQTAATTKRVDAVVRTQDLREKGFHLFSQGPKKNASKVSRHASHAHKFLSGRKLKRMGLSKIDEHLRYADLQPVATAWQQYASTFVDEQGNQASRLTYHGCPGFICRSKDPSLLHTCGIIAKDTATSWHVVSDRDKVVVCPKAGCHWQFSISGRTMVLSGPDSLATA